MSDPIGWLNQAQMGFAKPALGAGGAPRSLAIWCGHPTRKLAAFVATRKLDMGNPFPKWFKSIRFRGEGECVVRVIVDGKLVMQPTKVWMREGEASPSVLKLNNGTLGRWMVLEISGTTLPEAFDVEYEQANQ